jgi:hypothetical protein
MALAYEVSSPKAEPERVIAFPASALWYESYSQFFRQLRDDKGEPLDLLDHVIAKTVGWCDVMQDNPLLVLMAPRDHGKALALDTPVPTPTGWTTMGELVDGDIVLDDQGKPTTVTRAHAVRFDRPCYRVRFDDGFEITADAEHLWTTWVAGDRNPGKRRRSDGPAVRTTGEIAASLKVGREHNHSIPNTRPLDLPDVDLPMDPYVLGAWLGDGTTSQASITIHEPEQVVLIEQAGTQLRRRKNPFDFGMADTTWRLRQLGVLGNKHVPAAYLRASEIQRRALLAGLMDTDGSAAADGTVEFGTTLLVLAEGVAELAASLGFKPRTYSGRATLNGRDIGPCWRVCWSPRVPVFRLTRKNARLAEYPERGWRTRHRFIVAVDPVASVPVRCITVDSPSHLYLAGRQMVPTHNTWTLTGYLLWRAWKHNRDRMTGLLYEPLATGQLPDGQFQAVVFSETKEQAKEFMQRLQGMLLANLHLFSDLLPDFRHGKAQRRGVWSTTKMRLKNEFEVTIRAYRTSTRGMHPQLILLDDVLSEKNSQTAYQRKKVWNYFVGTLLPMNPQQLIVIGTPQHYEDLLFSLKPDPKKPPLTIGNKEVRFKWLKYKAVDWETEQVLWEARHNLANLRGLQALDPLIFAREYMLDPRDDASSMFPYPLTQRALTQGEMLTFVTQYDRQPGEYIILAADFAESEEIAADDTVIMVWAWSTVTQKRRLLWGVKAHGASFQAQIGLLRLGCGRYRVDLGVVEENGFQKWLYVESKKWPETAGRLFGHRTGREKSNLEEGVPSLKLSLQQDLWIMPCGDAESMEFAREWQAQMNAFGWKDGKLQGVGAHDDFVMCQWFGVRALRLIEELIGRPPDEQYVSGEEEGMERVHIGADY